MTHRRELYWSIMQIIEMRIKCDETEDKRSEKISQKSNTFVRVNKKY